ncbi:Protocadherin Fat 4-like [Oopsacas minuta]|uniref:Protocadherin Fat 4-like n=1 Tax=Oopsacas minuta TaxID=111878 RepID=A0AAV7KEJ0_9METZ|nr:Protocadherin Fat 4-like [Oopsacas minuta]
MRITFWDCDGVCDGTASITSCGLCTGGTTGLPVDYPLDCRGICFGNYTTDSCGVCQLISNPIDYRDCSGECFGNAKIDQCGTCYGGSSAVPSADSLLDQCDMCGGDGTSCIGCDNTIGSEVDNCGECEGDNCDCIKVTQVYPTSILSGEQTYVIVDGAGLFFKPDPLSPSTYDNGSYLPLCGGIRQYPGLDIFVPVSCIFSDNDAKEYNLAVEFYINQSRIVCKTPSEVLMGDYFVLIQFEDILNNIPILRTPINTSLPLRFFDNSVHQLSVVAASLSENSIGIETELFFDVISFESFPQLSCIINSFDSCGDIYSNPYIVSALFIHSGKIMCIIPPADYPCQVSISISINNQIAGIILQRDFPFSFFNPEPVVIQCKLEENLNSILIQFDHPLYVTDVSNGCSALFDSSTLTELASSLCYFIGTSNEYILIQLSTDAMLTYSSELIWKEDSIYAISQTNSFPLTTPTKIQLPDSIQNPMAIILGPEILPLTGSTYFTAHLSYPCGYKPFIYVWDIRASSLDFDISDASLKLSELDSTADTLVLDSSDIITGEDYTLILSIINSFGISSQVEKLLTKSIHITSPVILASNPVDKFNSVQDIHLYVLVDYPSNDIGGYSLAYVWKLEQILPSNEAIRIDLNDLISNSGTLLLPSGFLEPNFNYVVSVTVSFIELSGSETVSKDIFVETQSPISIIEGGNRQIGFNQVLMLDATNSIQHYGLYDWECFNTDTMLPCTHAINGITSVVELNTSSLIQEIQPNTLAIGSSYVFILTQSLSSHAVTISIQNNDVIGLYNSPLMYELIQDDVIVISSRLYGYEDIVSAYWQCEQIEGQGFITISSLPIQSVYLSSTQSVPLSRTQETVIYRSLWNELNLFLPVSAVSFYQNYTFSINVNNYKSSITLYSNTAPKSGQLVLSKSNGQPLTSEIQLEAKDFCDYNPTYEFYYIIDNSIKLIIQPRSVLSSAIFIPPLISTTQQTSTTIFVDVYSTAGKFVSTSNSFRIDILQGSATSKISSLLEITDKLISNQEYNKVISRVSTLIISHNYNSIHFPPNSTENLFTMLNTLSTTPTIPAYSNALYLDLIRHIKVDSLPSDQVNNYLEYLLRIARDVFYTLENIKVTPSHNFPSPVIVPYDKAIVLQFIEIIREIPITSQLDDTLYFTILDEISKILCLTSFFGHQPLNIPYSNLGLYFTNDYLYSEDNYCIRDRCEMNYIQFPLNLAKEYFNWECNTNSQYRCNGVCVTLFSVLFENLTENSVVDLSQTAQNTIDNSNQTKTGFYFNYNSTSIVTETFVLSMKNPITGINIELSGSGISVIFGLNQTQLIGDGLILCLYKEEQSTYWEVESFFPIQTITNSIHCVYTHFTQYTVARLNYSPIITPAPTTITPTPTNSTTRPPVVTTVAPVVQEFPVGIAVVPIIILVFVILGIIIVLLILFCLWKRKKSRLMELVSPSEEKLSEESVEVSDRMYFSICTISKSGQEDLIGKLQFPPSSRLREIRNSLLESFPENFEKKAFCFLTKQRERIDPGTENNHFLRIVYDSEVLVRFVDAKDEQFRTVFCWCGKIAFFECSRCHGQAYCSAECQLSDWGLHKSECILLTERKKRQDVLRKTQSSVLRTSVDLRQKRELDPPQISPKFDTWRAFLQSQGAPSDLSSSFPIREEPKLSMTDTQTEIPRISVAAARPLPPILGTIQHPLNKPAP